MNFICKKIVLLFVFLPLLLVTGCRQTLFTGLTENEANEMVLTLLKRGINADKEKAGKNGFSVNVEDEDLVRSLEIIKEHSLPHAKFQSLGQVFSGQGMISSQLEEQARLAYALSQELSETFSRIDGVLDSRVHVVLSIHNNSTGVTTPASAAIFIRHTKDSPVVDMVSSIKETAARSVPGLTFDRVSVMTEMFKENIVAPKIEKHTSTSNIWMWISIILILFSLVICMFAWKKVFHKTEGKIEVANK